MATHSGVLAWTIPGTGEPGGLPSMGSHSRTQLKQLSSSSSIVRIIAFKNGTYTYISRDHTIRDQKWLSVPDG